MAEQGGAGARAAKQGAVLLNLAIASKGRANIIVATGTSQFETLLVHPKLFFFVNGEGDAETEYEGLGTIIAEHPVDVAFVGIGENGHLAFNDPPADLETDDAYIMVKLDEACRKQQMGGGWFPTLDDVPTAAISMKIRHIMKSECIICSVPVGTGVETSRLARRNGLNLERQA